MWCSKAECPAPATVAWERWATPGELVWLKAQGLIHPDDTEARMPVRSCGDHAIPLELRPPMHDADCTAPPDCDCSMATNQKASTPTV